MSIGMILIFALYAPRKTSMSLCLIETCGVLGMVSGLAVLASTSADSQGRVYLPTLKVAFDIAGAITAKGTSDALATGSICADWAAGRQKVNPKPTIEFMTEFAPVGDQPFYLETVTRDYAGPGTYDGKVLPLMIWIGGKGWNRWGSSASDHAATRLRIAPDGSGSITFEGYISDRTGDPSYKTIAGTLTWACVSPK